MKATKNPKKTKQKTLKWNEIYGELWSKIRYLIRLVTKNGYEKHMKTKFNSNV